MFQSRGIKCCTDLHSVTTVAEANPFQFQRNNFTHFGLSLMLLLSTGMLLSCRMERRAHLNLCHQHISNSNPLQNEPNKTKHNTNKNARCNVSARTNRGTVVNFSTWCQKGKHKRKATQWVGQAFWISYPKHLNTFPQATSSRLHLLLPFHRKRRSIVFHSPHPIGAPPLFHTVSIPPLVSKKNLLDCSQNRQKGMFCFYLAPFSLQTDHYRIGAISNLILSKLPSRCVWPNNAAQTRFGMNYKSWSQ